jgi:polyisoprenoid-binding protein YceI
MRREWKQAVATGALALFVAPAVPPGALAAPGSGVAFTVDETRSSALVHVGKSGALAMLGHGHEIAAPVSGSIVADAGKLEDSRVELVFATARFHVVAEGEPAGDVPKVQEVMHSPRVLDAARFPEVRFVSRRIAGRRVDGDTGDARPGALTYELQVTGELTIHGVTREIGLPMRVTIAGGVLTAKGHGTVRQDQFGMTPVTAGGGTVRVRNEVEIDFTIAASQRAVPAARVDHAAGPEHGRAE